MNEYKVIFEATDTSIGNWPSHCLTAENWQAACEEAHNLIPNAGARIMKVLVNGLVRQRFGLRDYGDTYSTTKLPSRHHDPRTVGA